MDFCRQSTLAFPDTLIVVSGGSSTVLIGLNKATVNKTPFQIRFLNECFVKCSCVYRWMTIGYIADAPNSTCQNSMVDLSTGSLYAGDRECLPLLFEHGACYK